MTNAGLEALSRLSLLQHLELPLAKHVTDAGMELVAQRCTRLRTLNLTHCTNITGKAIEAFARNGKLECAILSGCVRLDDAAVACLAKQCSQLRTLNVGFCNQLTDAAVHAIATHCKSIEQLHMYECKKLTDSGVKAVAQACGLLKMVNFSCCEQLTSGAFRTFKISHLFCDRMEGGIDLELAFV